MPTLIKLKVEDTGSEILVDVTAADATLTGGGTVIRELDKALDKMLQHEIVENCRILQGAFVQLQALPTPPCKATAEIGLKFTGEGNIYVAKVSAEATYKLTIEWSLDQSTAPAE